ncbi:MAG: glycosyltransferase family 4 protein [Bacteroidia bacterium]|nr:glycosyltransferase family 4 protein [Bacteroidia bacterium]
MAEPLRILLLCSKFPYPPKDGGTMAMMSMIRGFADAGHHVTVLTMNTPKHYVQLGSLPSALREVATFIAVDVDTSVNFVDALANLLFSKESYHIQRFTSQAFFREIQDLLDRQTFDVIQLETLFMVPYLDMIRKLAPNALVTYRAHNVEHEIWARRAANELNPIKKAVLETTALRIEAYEQATISSNPFDVVVPITGKDAATLKKMGNKSPEYVCPAAMRFEEAEQWKGQVEWPSLFYLGALDWEPNKEGLRWFLKLVWPKMRKKYPALTFYIAGRNMPAEFSSHRDQNIQVLGEVESASDFIRPRGVMIVPILSGSGMRVKLLEGMAHRKAIVATTIAAEGMGVKSGEHLYLADEPQAFADAISTLIDNRALCELIADQGYHFVKSRFSNDKIVGGLLDFYRGKLSTKSK